MTVRDRFRGQGSPRAGAALLALALGLGGCGDLFGEPPPPEETEAPPPEEPPADELEASLRELGRERAPYMIREGDPMRGEGPARTARDFSQVVYTGYCYKLIGLGAEGIEDLDLRVYDHNGVLRQRDTTQDPRPYIGQMRPICPTESGTYRIEVRIVAGEGEFVAQLYRSI